MKLVQILIVINFILTSFLFTVGCGYHFGFHSRKLVGGYEHLAIPIFKNKTSEVGIETYFTNEIIRQLIRSGVAKVVNNKNEASVTLEGVVENINITRGAQASKSTIVHLPMDVVLNTEYRILVTTRVLLRRNSDNKVLWENVFWNERAYSAPQLGSAGINSANALYNQSARHQNIAKIAEEMMIDVHDRLTESF